MFIVQILGPSRRRSRHSIDVTVVVELTSRIQDLVQNESGELLAHGINPVDRVNEMNRVSGRITRLPVSS